MSKIKITRESHPLLVREIFEVLEPDERKNIEYIRGDVYECNLVVYLMEDYENCPPEFQDKLWISNTLTGDNTGNIDMRDTFEYFTRCKRKKEVTYTYKEK